MWKNPKRVRLMALAVCFGCMMGVIFLMPAPVLKYAAVPLLIGVSFASVIWQSAGQQLERRAIGERIQLYRNALVACGSLIKALSANHQGDEKRVLLEAAEDLEKAKDL